jgi:hypothetical protein
MYNYCGIYASLMWMPEYRSMATGVTIILSHPLSRCLIIALSKNMVIVHS